MLFTVVGLVVLVVLMTGVLTSLEANLADETIEAFGILADEENSTGVDRLHENLTAAPYPGTGGDDGYAEVVDGELAINLTRVNPSSETEVRRLFTLSYEGDEEIEVWVEAVNQESYPGEVRFYATEPEFVRFDEGGTVTLQGGEEAVVGIFISSFDAEASDVLLEEMRIHAVPADGADGSLQGTVSEDYGDESVVDEFG